MPQRNEFLAAREAAAPATEPAGGDVRMQIEALLRGEHDNPFYLLGMHREPPGEEVVVRTFQPQAAHVRVVDAASGEVVAELERVHPAGFFAGRTGRSERFRYRLRRDAAGRTVEFEDPYRFPPVLGELDLYLWAEGRHLRAYEKLGAHAREIEGVAGVAFAVWAPNARRVSVVGPFNNWDGRCHPMRRRVEGGVWEIFIPGLAPGELYKYEIKGAGGELLPLKADPFALRCEHPPNTASIVGQLGDGYRWRDEAWMSS
ncbi:MAG TPA: hypothetical protein VMI56_20845, partial [Reyranella sp.]|nr:hypothetical protein [Reyranella sp.]